MQDTHAARTPKEPHAQRSWHLQWSLPAQSEDLRTEVWLAESLRRRGASEELVEEPVTARRWSRGYWLQPLLGAAPQLCGCFLIRPD